MEHRYRILFTVDLDVDKVCTDAFYVVDMPRYAASRAVTKLTGEADVYAFEVENAYKYLQHRSRFASTGSLYNLHTDTPLTRYEVEVIMASHQKNGTLREFLKQARM